mmetsp:Transcript_79975/g.138804  ORF Transcript_79975/g.138804 Transcript_79975/m.138804 type:complete len:129 (+) Transcript_79975:136-522(+)
MIHSALFACGCLSWRMQHGRSLFADLLHHPSLRYSARGVKSWVAVRALSQRAIKEKKHSPYFVPAVVEHACLVEQKKDFGTLAANRKANNTVGIAGIVGLEREWRGACRHLLQRPCEDIVAFSQCLLY